MKADSLRASLPLPVLSPRIWAAVSFSLRTWLASMVALYLAFAFQLEAPYWAPMTTIIVGNPVAGMVLSKSLYRAFGTVVGAAFGMALIILFAQTPELFVLALALIVAGCTVAASLLTNFRAYGAALSSYTAGIVAAGAINRPDQVFFVATARVAAILLGLACAFLAASVFAPHRSEAETHQKLLALLQDAMRRAAYSWRGVEEVRRRMGFKLIGDLIALNSSIEFAAAESDTFRLQANNARSLVAHVLGLISARRSLDARLLRCGWPECSGLETLHERIIGFLEEMPRKLEQGDIGESIAAIDDVRRRLELLKPEHDMLPPDDLVSERLAIDRLDDLLSHLYGALQAWRDIVCGNWKRNEPRLVLNFHRDQRAACINGLRAFLAVVATGAFWIASAWPNGPDALIFVCIILSLISSNPHPDRAGWTLFYAHLSAAVLGLICAYLILPRGSGIEFPALAFGLFLFPLGLLVLANPSTAGAGITCAAVFVNLAAPTNPMTYDLASSLNRDLAVELGLLFGLVAFILLFPPNPQAARRYVTYRIRRGLEVLALRDPAPVFSAWETRMADRVYRLYDPQNLSGTHTDEWLEAGLGALALGDELLRLRHWSADERNPAQLKESVRKTLQAFGLFLRNPECVATEVKEQMKRAILIDPGPGAPGRRTWARITGALMEIESYLTHYRLLLNPEEIT